MKLVLYEDSHTLIDRLAHVSNMMLAHNTHALM